MRRAAGYTLVELLVVVAVLAVLVGLLLPAVQRVRLAAAVTDERYRLKQLGLGVHEFAGRHGGRLPHGSHGDPGGYGVFVGLLPYTEAAGLYRWPWAGPAPTWRVKLFVSPLDPTVSVVGSEPGVRYSECSFAANARAFGGDGGHRLAGLSDGLSGTVLFATHYAVCGAVVSANPLYSWHGPFSVDFHWTNSVPYAWDSYDPVDAAGQPPTFAEKPDPRRPGESRTDYHPLTTGFPPTSRAKDGVTFQVRPTPQQCDPKQPNTGNPGGLSCGMADGSVRTFRPGVAPEVFWGSVTPAAGEVVAAD